ncbi:hypothetical protein T439DRAFT_326344 [Meredithblackwellia eburnea MCA 4105]
MQLTSSSFVLLALATSASLSSATPLRGRSQNTPAPRYYRAPFRDNYGWEQRLVRNRRQASDSGSGAAVASSTGAGGGADQSGSSSSDTGGNSQSGDQGTTTTAQTTSQQQQTTTTQDQQTTTTTQQQSTEQTQQTSTQQTSATIPSTGATSATTSSVPASSSASVSTATSSGSASSKSVASQSTSLATSTFTTVYTDSNGSATTSTGTATSTAVLNSKTGSSSSTGKTWGIVGGVVGGVIALVGIIFVIYRLSQRRFSSLDNDADEIKWPELNPDGTSAATSTLNPLGTRRTGGAGVEMSERDGQSEYGGEGGTSYGTSGQYHSRTSSYEPIHYSDAPPAGDPAYYDPYLGPSAAPYPPPQNIYHQPPSPPSGNLQYSASFASSHGTSGSTPGVLPPVLPADPFASSAALSHEQEHVLNHSNSPPRSGTPIVGRGVGGHARLPTLESVSAYSDDIDDLRTGTPRPIESRLGNLAVVNADLTLPEIEQVESLPDFGGARK